MEDGAKDIVLVEDNPGDVAIALRAFRRSDLADRVRVLRDGEEALAWLRGGGADAPPRVILLDLRMPKVDGWEVLRELRADARTREVPVVVVSSSDRESDVRESYRLGADGFVVKRFDASRPGEFFVEAARHWLDGDGRP